MKILLLAFACFAVGLTEGRGQVIVLKDGKRVTAKALRRVGDNIMATSPTAEGAAAVNGEVGYPLAQIETLEFPEPAVLKSAPDLIAKGNQANAIAQLDSALNYFGGFRDAPGSYWAELTLLKMTALVTAGKDADAEPLANQIIGQGSNAETARAAQAHLAGIMGRKGDHERAIQLCDRVLKDGARADTLAIAAMSKGRNHQALKQWDSALLAFLNIPVFYPEEKAFLPQSMLGAGQCYFELNDLPRAKDSLNELIKSYPNGPEATQAKTELDKIARREKALESVP